MKIKNLVFCGFMGSILMAGGAYAEITTADATTLATAKYVKQGVASAIDYTDTTVGTLANLQTDANTNVVAAINELAGKIEVSDSGLDTRVTALETTVGKAADDQNPATGLVAAVAKNASDISSHDDAIININNALGEGFDSTNTVKAAIAAETLARTNADAGLQQAINTLNGDASTTGSVAKKIADALESGAASAAYTNTTSGLTATTIQGAIDEVEGRVDTIESDLNTATTGLKAKVSALESGKQDTLTAGAGIDITNNTISVEATGTGAYYYDAGAGAWSNLPITTGDFTM